MQCELGRTGHLGSRVAAIHSIFLCDVRCAAFFPPDLATAVSIWIASRSDRLAKNGSSRGRSRVFPFRFHSQPVLVGRGSGGRVSGRR